MHKFIKLNGGFEQDNLDKSESKWLTHSRHERKLAKRKYNKRVRKHFKLIDSKGGG